MLVKKYAPIVHLDAQIRRPFKQPAELAGMAAVFGKEHGEASAAGTDKLVPTAVLVGDGEEPVHELVAAVGVQLLVQPPCLQQDLPQLVKVAAHQGLPPQLCQGSEPLDAGYQQVIPPEVADDDLLQHLMREPDLHTAKTGPSQP